MLTISPTSEAPVSGYDYAEIEAAAQAEATAPGWVIMWRCWRRCYTAWECTDPNMVRIVEAPTIEELLAHMQLLVVERWWGSPPSPPRSSLSIGISVEPHHATPHP